MQKQIFSSLGRRIELWAHPDPDHMGRTIRVNRSFYEIDVLMKCREIYLPGSAIIDVGANIGNHAVFFGAISECAVYAFDPMRRTVICSNGISRSTALMAGWFYMLRDRRYQCAFIGRSRIASQPAHDAGILRKWGGKREEP